VTVPSEQPVLPTRTSKAPFSSACQVTVVPALVGSGETDTMVTVGVIVSLVTESVAEPVLVAASVTQTRRSLEPSARKPAVTATPSIAGLVV
jgi:hypothetical protein